MNQYSYSRVTLFNDCPFHYKLRYIDKLTEIPKLDADNPLIIGSALHKGIETDVKTALDEYFNSFPVLTNDIIQEAIKLEILIPKVKNFLEENFENCELIHEYKLDFPNYVGYVDLIIKAPDDTCMVMDFKYSNNIGNYLESGQLHIYKDFLEQDGFKVKRLAYLFIPKVNIKQKENEDLFHYRKRIIAAVEESEVKFIPIQFDEMETIYFLNNIKKIESTKDFSAKNVSGNCFSCNPRFAPNYLEIITNEEGEFEMVLPKNERRERKIDTNPDFWIYGDSYVGKSTFVDNVKNVLVLNTDGNTDNTTAPVIMIKDEVKKEGRRTIRKLAWEVFLDTIAALETEENDFEAVAIDLIEDLREQCRYYVFEKNGWEHESDGSYGKGWSKVQTEWQRAIKRLKSLGYQLIYISKEKVEEIVLKGGAKRTVFKPNIDDKFANFLTGTVDLTMRAFINSDGERLLQLGKKPNVFGGGRFDFQVDECPLNMEEFIAELKAAQEGKVTKTKTKRQRLEQDEEVQEETTKRRRRKADEDPEENDNVENVDVDEATQDEEKPKRERRSRKSDEDQQNEQPAAEEKIKRQRRSRKTTDDDETPPGEEETAGDDQEEEKPKRTRRRRTRTA
ncbi:AAA family ATPase [Aeribacillus pallidus]|nr:AAA family ATPase [Aeribacillus pallidus]